MLDHDWLAACEITERAVADPGGLQTGVCRLGATELAAGCLDEALVVPRGPGDVVGVGHAPTPAAQHREVGPYMRESQLERHRRVPRKIQERKEAVALGIRETFPPEQLPSSPPVRDGGIGSGGFGGGHRRPGREKHDRGRVLPNESAVWK